MPGACPVCTDRDLITIRAFGEYRLWECRLCGVQHWTPLVHPQAAYYEDEEVGMYADKHRGGTGLERRFEPFLADFGGIRGKRVLDVGCSDGWLLAELGARGNEVYGIDIDAKALEVARRRGIERLWRAPVETFVQEARARDLSFDVITLFDVLEHTTDPVRVLQDLSGLLTANGVLVGTVPNRRRLLVNQVMSDFPPHHFFRFDAAALRACATRGGVTMHKVEIFEWGYTGPIAVAAIRRRLRGSSRTSVAAEAEPDRRGRPGRSLRRLAVRALQMLVGPPSAVLERPLGRGFKLYFVAGRTRP